MKKNNIIKITFIYILIAIFIIICVNIFNSIVFETPSNINYNYSHLVNDIKNNNISNIKIEANGDDTGVATISLINVETNEIIHLTLDIPSISSFMNLIHSSIEDSNTLSFQTKVSIPKEFSAGTIIMSIIIIIIVLLIIVFLGSQSKSSPNRALTFGKNKAKLIVGSQTKVTFNDVAGLKEERYDLEEVVEFLKSPQKFVEIGARIPKGILLVGPPGTGKTLLARAIAGEAGVNFFSISGSDFVEMFVGVGASRVRDLFKEAKQNKPALIFIDEIDAVGRKRGSGLGGGHDEREQTLNQLLVEMDGFIKNEEIIILAATNRVDILDPALLRPGRFDRQIIVTPPDVKGREDILKVHAKNKKLDENVDLEEVARITAGFTGAELENLLNESAIMAAKRNEKNIKMKHIRKSFVKVGVGTERKSRIISQEERELTAYHEAGHAILFEMLNLLDPVHIVSIIPTGRAGGYTMPLPIDKQHLSKKYLEQYIISLFGGRIAEDIIFQDITTGASNDIEKATSVAHSMITDYGMSSLGPIKFDKDVNSQDLRAMIDKEAEKIISVCYEKATKIINDNLDILHSCAKLLLEKEKITGDEFRALFPENYLPEKKKPKFVEFNVNDLIEENTSIELNTTEN